MMRMFILLSVLQVLSLNEAYNFSCPSQAHWKLRAKSKCRPARNYTCLYDVTFRVNVYRDGCSRPRILAPGYKYVFQPNLNRAYCRFTRYQPFIFDTVGYSDCAFQKSLCNGEGQITYENGKTTSDRTCLCDTEKGYTFLRNPKNQCYCNPSNEDCSCYVGTTNSSKDLKCYGETIIPQRRLQEESLNQSQALKINDFDNYKYNLEVPSNEYRTQAVVYVLISVLLCPLAVGMHMLQEIIRQWIKTKSNFHSEKYARLIKDKELENRYFIKVMIVGKESAGKTSLLRRLLKEDFNAKEQSTDGIDIIVRRCKINIKDGEWLIGKDFKDDKLERLKRTHNMKSDLVNQETVLKTKDDINKRRNISLIAVERSEMEEVTQTRNKDKDEYIQQSLVQNEHDSLAYSTTSSREITIELSGESSKDIRQNKHNLDEPNLPKLEDDPSDILYSLLSSIDFEKPSGDYALCGLWDFAGQKEFYVTHQVFLTSYAVYLLVTDLGDCVNQSNNHYFADPKDIGEYVNFWFDSIHCLRHEDKLVDTSTDYHIDPPVIIVCTGIDKYTNQKDSQKQLCLKHLHNVLASQSKFKHYRTTFFVSNKEDTDDVFQKIRHEISQTAKEMSNWGEKRPLQWILLEHFIEKIKSQEIVIVTYKEIYQFASKSDFGIASELELKEFLKFQHDVGNVIFFKEIGDYVILNPQWLADAFRCLVSDRIEPKILNHPDLKNFRQTGELSNKLITDMFLSKPRSLFSKYKEHLLKVMEKFDIIVQPIETNLEKNRFYILPSMMQSSTLTKVCELFKVDDNRCTRTSWLCIEFNFLPPAFFFHILVWYIRQYKISKVKDGDYKINALYRGIGVFDLEGSGRPQLVVTASKNTVAVQIWIWKHYTEVKKHYIDIREEFCSKIEKLQQRYRLQLTYKQKITCSDGDICTSSVEVEKLQQDELYRCPEHTPHSSNDVLWPWFKKFAKVEKTKYDMARLKPEQDKLNPSNIIEMNLKPDINSSILSRDIIQRYEPSESRPSSRKIGPTSMDVGDLTGDYQSAQPHPNAESRPGHLTKSEVNSPNNQPSEIRLHYHQYYNSETQELEPVQPPTNNITAVNILVGDKGQTLAGGQPVDMEEVRGEVGSKDSEPSMDSSDQGMPSSVSADVGFPTNQSSDTSTGRQGNSNPTKHEDKTGVKNTPFMLNGTEAKFGTSDSGSTSFKTSDNESTNLKEQNLKPENKKISTKEENFEYNIPPKEITDSKSSSDKSLASSKQHSNLRTIRPFTANPASTPLIALVPPVKSFYHFAKQIQESSDDERYSESIFLKRPVSLEQTVSKVTSSRDSEQTLVKTQLGGSPLGDSPGSSVDPDDTEVLEPIRRPNDYVSSLETDGSTEETSTALTKDDLEIQAVLHSLEMGYTQEQVRDALTLLRQRRPDHQYFSINDMLDVLTGRTKKEAVKQIDKNPGEENWITVKKDKSGE